MVATNELDFDTFLSIEAKNLKRNVNKFKEEMVFFRKLDSIFQRPIPRLNQSGATELKLQLYYFVHYYLYSSITNLFRTHLSESLSSLRVAIDAGLSAYEIIQNPESIEEFYKRGNRFKFIKRTIEKKVSKNDPKYDLANPLLIVHGFCSMIGSHADYSSFFYRIDDLKDIPPETEHSRFFYFQNPDSDDEYKYYFYLILISFFQIFQIFLLFINKTLDVYDGEWESQISSFQNNIKTTYFKYSKKFRNGSSPNVDSAFS